MASKRNQRRKNCQNKKGYPNFNSAEIACNKTEAWNRDHSNLSGYLCSMRPYKCPMCGQWHIGHERVKPLVFKTS